MKSQILHGNSKGYFTVTATSQVYIPRYCLTQLQAEAYFSHDVLLYPSEGFRRGGGGGVIANL